MLNLGSLRDITLLKDDTEASRKTSIQRLKEGNASVTVHSDDLTGSKLGQLEKTE